MTRQQFAPAMIVSCACMFAGCQQAPEKTPAPTAQTAPAVLPADDPGRVVPPGSVVPTRETPEGSLAERGQSTAAADGLNPLSERDNLGQHELRAEDKGAPGQTKDNPGKPPQPPPSAAAAPMGADGKATGNGAAAPMGADGKATGNGAAQPAAKDATTPGSKTDAKK